MSKIPAIEAHDLVKTFGPTRALDGLSLQAPPGSILGVLGPNGAGKTTAVRVLTTLSAPDSGSARIAGFDVRTQAHQVRRRIGLTGQYAALDECLSGRANLVMIGRLAGSTRREANRRATEFLERFALTDVAGRIVKTYSGGMRRRLDLAASLLSRPEVLFLDEPTTGLDPRSRNTVRDIVVDLVDDGTTLLLTTQYLEEADQLADSIVVVDHGTVIAHGTADELKQRVGGERLHLVVDDRADVIRAADVMDAFTEGRVQIDHGARAIDGAITQEPGLLAAVIRALDDVGIGVDDLAMTRPSLDDVFLTLTGHEAGHQAGNGTDNTTDNPTDDETEEAA